MNCSKNAPAHPSVLALDDQIQRIQEQLAAIPAEIPVALNESAGAGPDRPSDQAQTDRQSVVSDAATTVSSTKPISVEDQRQYRDLLIAAGQARDAYRSAIDSESAEWNRLQSSGRSCNGRCRQRRSFGQSRKAMPADEKQAANPAIGAIIILTLFSLAVGFAVAMRIQRSELTFRVAAEIESTLGLPVLARLGPR